MLGYPVSCRKTQEKVEKFLNCRRDHCSGWEVSFWMFCFTVSCWYTCVASMNEGRLLWQFLNGKLLKKVQRVKTPERGGGGVLSKLGWGVEAAFQNPYHICFWLISAIFPAQFLPEKKSMPYLWLVSFAAVIRVVTQRSFPLTAAHSSSAFLSLFYWEPITRMYLLAAHQSYFSLHLPPKTRFPEYGSLFLIGQFVERNAELEWAAVSEDDRCVTTLITAAKESNLWPDPKSIPLFQTALSLES